MLQPAGQSDEWSLRVTKQVTSCVCLLNQKTVNERRRFNLHKEFSMQISAGFRAVQLFSLRLQWTPAWCISADIWDVTHLHMLYARTLLTCAARIQTFSNFPDVYMQACVWNVTPICMLTMISSEIIPDWLMATLLPQKPPWAMWYDSPVIRH